MDRDTVAGKDKHRKKLIQFLESETGILLGTQMIAKGLHIPQVTLVGVINADTALNFPDIRAAERTFQVLMQVAGRAGRGEIPGEVIIQTFQPENYALKAVMEGDYHSFYEKETSYRRELNYPPYTHLINITVSGLIEKDTRMIMDKAAESVSEAGLNYIGPSPSPLYRLRGAFRRHLIIKTSQPKKSGEVLRDKLENVITEAKKKQVTLIIDVDPYWMM